MRVPKLDCRRLSIWSCNNSHNLLNSKKPFQLTTPQKLADLWGVFVYCARLFVFLEFKTLLVFLLLDKLVVKIKKSYQVSERL